MMESLQPACLLHARDYRDACLLVELFTPGQGRISAVAKGARRSRKGYSQRAILQPFQPLWIAVGGRGELKTLRTAEGRDSAVPLHGRALFSGLYLNELLCRLLPREDPHPELFSDYESALAALVGLDAIDIVLRQFELRLLEELGYGFSLEFEAQTGAPIAPDRRYHFDPQAGLLRSVAGAAEPLFEGADIAAFVRGDYTEAARRAMKVLCRLALRPHLGNKPLLSRQLFIGER